MDIPFKPISLKDKEVITSYTFASNYRNCDFSFANMCSFQFIYDSEFAVVDGFLLIRFKYEEKTRTGYMMPVGNGDLKHILQLLEEDAKKRDQCLCFIGVTPEGKIDLENALPNEFHYIPERDYFDYIYLREDLASLSGKKFQSKRNHINNFKKRYDYEYLPITPELVPFCQELETKWYKANRTEEDKEELSHERRSLTYALHNFEALSLRGCGICVNNEIVAFSFGTAINRDTFAVHIEKADINYDGAYAAINQAFASHLPGEFIYINREEDLGIPGLRQAKLSYHPTILLEKSVAVKKTSKS